MAAVLSMQYHLSRCMVYVYTTLKDPGWWLLMCYKTKSALIFHILFSLGYALAPVSTQQVGPAHSYLSIWWGYVAVWISCNESVALLSAETFTPWHASQSWNNLRRLQMQLVGFNNLSRQHMWSCLQIASTPDSSHSLTVALLFMKFGPEVLNIL